MLYKELKMENVFQKLQQDLPELLTKIKLTNNVSCWPLL